MKRKMIGIATGYVSGLFFVSFFTDVRQLAIPATAFLIYVVIGKLKGFSVSDFAIVSTSFAAAFTVGELYTHYVYNDIISYSGTCGSFSGTVSDCDVYDNDKARYIIKGKINGFRTAEIIFYTSELDAEYGDRIIIEDCTFEKISGDYLFDSENYYKADGIFLTVQKVDGITIKKRHSRKIKNFLMDYKEKIISDFRVRLGDDCGGFLSGMVFGEKRFLDDGIKNSLYRTGIGHIMAVSGLHISVIAVFIMYLFKRLCLNKFVSFGLVNIFMALMVTMANTPVSAVRAMIMFDTAYSAGLFRRKNDTFNSLAVAVFAICLVNPYAIYSQGFMLSVAGTFGIGVFAPYMVKNIRHDKKLLHNFLMMICATVATMPLSMLYFDEVSVISPVANILIVPLCTVCMVMGMLYTITGGLLPILESAGGIIKIVLFISGKVSESDLSYISCGNDFPAKLAFICVSAVIMVRITTGNRQYISLAIAASVAVTSVGSEMYRKSGYDKFRVAVVGKSHNAAVIVSYHNSSYIIDMADYRNPQYVSKYLSNNNTDNVEYIILHGNVQSLYASYISELDSVKVGKWLVYGNTSPCTDDNIMTFNDGYEIKSEDYSIIYTENILRIVYGDSEITFVSAKSDVPENRGLTVFYGNITKDTVIHPDGRSIYLDNAVGYEYSGMNNFEAEVGRNGSFVISYIK
ncbi:MAG: ComEC/Rec2 family competence protein [Ruminococcus sp.]|nr:ComEC/Rec2 family competence protein [Ruminococcus sp.]